jgi:hypothetical protein
LTLCNEQNEILTAGVFENKMLRSIIVLLHHAHSEVTGIILEVEQEENQDMRNWKCK